MLITVSVWQLSHLTFSLCSSNNNDGSKWKVCNSNKVSKCVLVYYLSLLFLVVYGYAENEVSNIKITMVVD